MEDLDPLGLVGQILHLPWILSVKIEFLRGARRGEEKFFGQRVQFAFRLQCAEALDDDFPVLVVAGHKVWALRIEVLDIKVLVGSDGTYAVDRFPASVASREDSILGLVIVRHNVVAFHFLGDCDTGGDE